MTLRAGSPGSALVYVAHDLTAGGLLAAILLKLYRSVPRAIAARRHWRLGLGFVVTAAALGGTIAGFAWVASGTLMTIHGWTVLTVHAWFGLVLGPLVFVHLLPRRWRLLRPRIRLGRPAIAGPQLTEGRLRQQRTVAPHLARRSFLSAAALAAIGGAAWLTAGLAERLAGGARRFTGSRWLAPGSIPPTTTFLGEPTPQIDPKAWRLRVHGRVEAPFDLDLDGLREMGQVHRTAVLDCTSGWALETTWTGVPLAALLQRATPVPSAGRVTVRSLTGWSTDMPLSAAGDVLLATGVAGGPLPVPNGAPCRLVVPDRRGLDWVKWVADVEIS